VTGERGAEGGDAAETAAPVGIGLALPRAAALTRSLLDPTTRGVSASDFQRLRARLLRELPPLVDGLPPSERLQIGSYELAVAREHPERCASPRATFVVSPAHCRRAIGLAAVERCVRGRAPGIQSGVAEVLASGVEDLVVSARTEGAPRPPWWAEWYGGLAPGGRATVQAEAVTWATQLWTALDWRLFERPPVIGGRDDWWVCPGRRQLVVRGRSEIRAWVGSRPAMLVVTAGFPGPGWRAELAHRALVCLLARGERSLPVRVVGLWPASGLVRICEVDAPALSEAAAALVSAVATWVEAICGSRRRDQVAC
jgi:hypothetical protein